MRILGFVFLLFVAPLAHAAAGVFSDVDGETRIQRGDAYYTAAPGVEVEADDIVETGDNAAAQVEMNDGTILKLGANTRLLLADYKLDTDNSVLTAGLEVLSGWLRFAVAKLHGSDRRFDINTPTMTVGIRGTEGVIEAANERNGLLLEEGRVAVRAADAGTMPVSAGQYIERAAGRPFARPGAVPAAFRARLPMIMRERAVRRAQFLRARGVPPRMIRRIQREDRERYLRQHPYLKQRLEQRFRERVRSDPTLRQRLRERPQRSPGGAVPPAGTRSEAQQQRREELRHRREEQLKRRHEHDAGSERPADTAPDPRGDTVIA